MPAAATPPAPLVSPLTGLITNLGSATLPELYTMAIFGIGALLIYIAPLVVIMGWEARQAKQAQGVTTVAPYVMKAMIYSIGWTLFVTAFFVFPLIMVGGTDKANPIYGIWSFFHVDWLDAGILSSLAAGVGGSVADQKTAQAIAMIMMASRMAYTLMLMGFLFITFSFASTITGTKYKSQNDAMDFGFIGSFAITALTSIVAYNGILAVTSNTLESCVSFGIATGKITGGPMAGNPTFDVGKDIAILVVAGLNSVLASMP